MENLIKFFTQSSEDPAKTSATLTGLLIMGSSYAQSHLDFIPFVHDFFVSPIGMQVEPIATCIGFIVGGIWTLFGIFRKITNKVEEIHGLRVE